MENPQNRFGDCWRFLTCPVCARPLTLRGNSLVCPKRHCYDVAKQGYVNLAGKAATSAYYSRESFDSRGRILRGGYYDAVLKGILETLAGLEGAETVLDAGCGEGFYAREIAKLPGKEVLAFDLSRESVKSAAAADRDGNVRWFVGDLCALPIRKESVDCVLDIFSPANYGEFDRVLKKGGYVVKAVPTEDHVRELREAARDQLRNREYSNQSVKEYFREHFRDVETRVVGGTYPIGKEDLEAFVNMTPLLFNADREKLALDGVREITVAAEILVGRKPGGALSVGFADSSPKGGAENI